MNEATEKTHNQISVYLTDAKNKCIDMRKQDDEYEERNEEECKWLVPPPLPLTGSHPALTRPSFLKKYAFLGNMFPR